MKKSIGYFTGNFVGIAMVFLLLCDLFTLFPALAKNTLSDESTPILIPLKNIEDLVKIKTLTGHSQAVENLAFSPDGKILASGSGDASIILWDVESGEKMRQLMTSTRFNWEHKFCFSPDGKTLASVMGEEKIILWDLSTGEGKVLYETYSDIHGIACLYDIAFSPDGNIIATGSHDQGISLRNVQTGKNIKTLKGHPGALYAVKFSPDGDILAAASEDESIVFWEVKTGKKIKVFEGHSADILDIAFSPDGKTLASGGTDKSIILWDVATGNKIKSIQGLDEKVEDLDFSPDGKTLATAVGPQIILLDLKTGGKMMIKCDAYCLSVAFSPDGRLLVSGSKAIENRVFNPEKSLVLWDVGLLGDIERQFKKDEFETTSEYEARISQVEVPYSIDIELKKEQYNADRGGFEVNFKGNKLLVQVEREKARELLNRKTGEIKFAGKLKYYNPENLILVEASVIDSVSLERYTVYKVTEKEKEKE
jgi:WD40 repeat protein